MTDVEMRKVYRGLAKIEDTFKVTKTTLESRPVFVWTTESIKAHFLTCFTALVLLRFMEKKTEEKYTPEQLKGSMAKYGCISIGTNKYQFTYYDEVIQACAEAFNLDLKKKYRTKQQIRKLLKY